MRAFVTGARGFVGTWLRAHLEASGDEVLDATGNLDVTDADASREVIAGSKPAAVYHLAALTNVARSWTHPAEVFRVNAMGTLNVLEAARACKRPPAVLLVGSAEVYGPVSPDELPLTEDSPLRPVTPYAASKVAAEFLGIQAHLGHGLHVVIARPFNHIGPGQLPEFAASALARRIVQVEQGKGRSVPVGNLSPRRDFTDVRDVVRAYRMLLVDGQSGTVYNVCSGRDVTIADVAGQLLGLAKLDATLERDPSLERPVDVPVLRGDASRLISATGWQPRIPLEQSLRDVLDYWRRELAVA